MEWVQWAMDWPVGTIVSLTVFGVCLLVGWMLSVMIYQHLDMKWGKSHIVTGTVKHKEHDDGWREYAAAPTMLGTSSVPTKAFPDAWHLTVEVRGHVQIFPISKAFFDRVQIGQRVPVEAVVGYYSKKKRLTRILSEP